MTKDEALQMCLEYIETNAHERKYVRHAIKQALAAPVQEPVAAECKFDREQKWVRCEIAHHNLVQSEPHHWPGYQTRLLYTTPPAQQAMPLTVEQIYEIADSWAPDLEKGALCRVAREVEAAHGITKGQP